ncbi:hypothetical protein R0J90_19175, partial [Micrococcus sp. SIMBA_144]
ELKKFLRNKQEKKEAVTDHEALKIVKRAIPFEGATATPEESEVQGMRKEPQVTPSIQDSSVQSTHVKETNNEDTVLQDNDMKKT